MAPTDDEDARRPAAAAASGEATRPRGRVRAAPPRRRPEARVRAPRSRPAAAPQRTDGDRRARTRAAATTTEGQKRKIVLLSVLTAVVLALAVGAFVIGQGASTTPRTAAGPDGGTTTVPEGEQLPTAPGPTLPDSAFAEFRDDETGTTMKYPKDWTRLNTPVREMRLVATPNAQDYVQLRVHYTETPTNTQNLANIKAITDGSIGQNETIQILDQKPISVNGLIGYYYLYTFTDEKSGLRGAHAHYFLFQGRKMNAIVFQALPTERFQDLKGVFDQMLLSFHSEPEPPASTAPPAPAPPPPS